MGEFGEKQYVAFTIVNQEQNYVFAVPVENIDTLVPLTREIPFAVLPHTSSQVLCVMNPYGKLVTVINLLNLFGIPFIPKTANIIIVFNFMGKVIGVPAQSAHLVSACSHEMTEDKATGTKIFEREKVQYLALDIPRLYKYLEQ